MGVIKQFELPPCLVDMNIYHRIMQWFGLEGMFKISQIPPPLDQVAKVASNFQTRGSHNFSGQPLPVPHHSHSQEFLPNM